MIRFRCVPKRTKFYAQTPLILGTLNVGAGALGCEMPTRTIEIPELSSVDMDRFLSRVGGEDGEGTGGECWEWMAGRGAGGYGVFHLAGKQYRAHRVSWMIANGTDPAGLCILHRCDNPGCVNPEHLFTGSHIDNVVDRCAKGRTSAGKQHYSHTDPERLARGINHGSYLHPESRPRGANHWSARLTEEQVIEIRKRFCKYSRGANSQRALAKEYNVNEPTISNIVLRQTWKHLEE